MLLCRHLSRMVELFILNRRIIVLIGIFSMKMKLLVIMIPMVRGMTKGMQRLEMEIFGRMK